VDFGAAVLSDFDVVFSFAGVGAFRAGSLGSGRCAGFHASVE
jgi:hypothetical protein